jgi:hypothetical protein
MEQDEHLVEKIKSVSKHCTLCTGAIFLQYKKTTMNITSL